MSKRVGVVTKRELNRGGVHTLEKNVVPCIEENFSDVEKYFFDKYSLPVNYPLAITLNRLITSFMILYHRKQIIKWANSKGIDILFVPTQSRLVFDPSKVECEVVVYTHDIIPETHNYDLYRESFLSRARRLLIAGGRDYYLHNLIKSDLLLTPTQFTADELERRTVYRGEKEVVSCGIEMPKAEADYRDIDLIYTGNLAKRKDPQTIREVFEKANSQGYNVVSVNYQGIDLPGENYENISDRKLGSLYARSRYYLHPSFAEGFGRGPVEAQSYGCVPLARDIPVNHEVLGEAGESWVTIDGVKDAISYLSKERVANRAKCVENAERYNWEETRHKIIQALRE